MAEKRSAEPIADVLKSVFSKLEDPGEVTQEAVEERWRTLAGPDGAKHSKTAGLRKGVLTVRIDSSGWMQELSMQKRRILKGLQSQFGKDRISEIHFKIGEF